MIDPTTNPGREAALSAAMERNILREKMIRSGEKCGNAVLNYFAQAGISSQEQKMRYVLKDLLYAQTEDPEYLCETIYSEANSHLAGAMRHGYSPEDLAELRSNIDHYRVLMKNKREVMSSKKRLEEIVMDFGIRGRFSE